MGWRRQHLKSLPEILYWHQIGWDSQLWGAPNLRAACPCENKLQLCSQGEIWGSLELKGKPYHVNTCRAILSGYQPKAQDCQWALDRCTRDLQSVWGDMGSWRNSRVEIWRPGKEEERFWETFPLIPLENEKDTVFINHYPEFYSLTLISKSYGGGKFNVTQSTVSDYYCILKTSSLDTS